MLESGVLWEQSNSRCQAFEETNSFYSVWWVLTSFCRELREEEKCTVTSCRTVIWSTQQTSQSALDDVRCKELMPCGLWLPKAPNVNPCHYNLWGTVKEFMWTVHILHKNWNILKSKLLIFQNVLIITKLFKCKENADITMEVTQYILLYTEMYIIKCRYRNTNFSKKSPWQMEWWKLFCEKKRKMCQLVVLSSSV